MNIDENKAIFQCAFLVPPGSWSSSRDAIIVVAKDFEHARILALEYADKEQRDAPVVQSGDDASLNKKDVEHTIGEIKMLYKKVVY